MTSALHFRSHAQNSLPSPLLVLTQSSTLRPRPALLARTVHSLLRRSRRREPTPAPIRQRSARLGCHSNQRPGNSRQVSGASAITAIIEGSWGWGCARVVYGEDGAEHSLHLHLVLRLLVTYATPQPATVSIDARNNTTFHQSIGSDQGRSSFKHRDRLVF